MNNGLNFPNHATYEPPVILPSALTNNQYIMVFTSNLIAGYGIQYGGAVFYSTSPNGVGNWTTPSVLIENITVDNICDMADARPVWDGSRWHIFIQAVTGNYKSGSCSPTKNVYEAVGTRLSNPPSIDWNWVLQPGTSHAQQVTYVTSGVGIGEDMQWFNTAPYGGLASYPLMITYNNWSYSTDPTYLFAYLFNTGVNASAYLYGPVFTPSDGTPYFNTVYYYPDAILLGSLDAATLGNPGIGFESTCPLTDARYSYAVAIAYFPDPQSHSAQWGTPYAGPLESRTMDSVGPRMFRPKVARNEYGFIPRNGPNNTWLTYWYYNDTQINGSANNSCAGYGRYLQSDQRFSVTQLQISEQ